MLQLNSTALNTSCELGHMVLTSTRVSHTCRALAFILALVPSSKFCSLVAIMVQVHFSIGQFQISSIKPQITSDHQRNDTALTNH